MIFGSESRLGVGSVQGKFLRFETVEVTKLIVVALFPFQTCVVSSLKHD